MQVKICGLQTAEDVDIINKQRPDYAGFVFAPGRHQVKLEQVQTLRSQMAPGIKSVGVFVNAETTLVAAQSKLAGLDVIQLHGDETPGYIRELRLCTRLPLVKAISLGGSAVTTAELRTLVATTGINAFLFDRASSTSYGGTGKSFNLGLLEKLAVPLKFFVAGGLTAMNVQQVIYRIRQGHNGLLFKGVDVSSALETDGHKDYEKAAAFLSAVHSAAVPAEVRLKTGQRCRKEGRS